jgi:transcriptional regulator with XRE-family HTH domain
MQKQYDAKQGNRYVPGRRAAMSAFSERLKELRNKAGLSQSQLASSSGMSLSAVHDYEQGKREPSLKSAVKLAAALGVDCRAFADAVQAEEEAPRKLAGKEAKGK